MTVALCVEESGRTGHTIKYGEEINPREKTVTQIESLIHVIRRQKVTVDADLADLYGVPTGALNQAVRRNMERFPEDFAFRLSKAEFEHWKSQIVIPNPSARMGLRRAPFVFTQEGVAMLSAVLRSDRAVQMSIAIVRTFVRMRELMAANKDIARFFGSHEEYDKVDAETV
jgi:hypothetical protein